MNHYESAMAFATGMLTMGFLVAAMFFLRFFRRTGDRLFVCFSFAFLLLALNQAIPQLLNIPSEDQAGIYLLRLAAFVVIIAAILFKNLASSEPRLTTR